MRWTLHIRVRQSSGGSRSPERHYGGKIEHARRWLNGLFPPFPKRRSGWIGAKKNKPLQICEPRRGSMIVARQFIAG